MIRFDAFGRLIDVERTSGGWRTYDVGDDGKRRPAHDIVLPPGTPEGDLERALADLLHEWARPGHDRVVRVR